MKKYFLVASILMIIFIIIGIILTIPGIILLVGNPHNIPGVVLTAFGSTLIESSIIYLPIYCIYLIG